MSKKQKPSIWRKLAVILLVLILLIGATGIYLKYQYKDIVKEVIKNEVGNVVIPDVYSEINFTVLQTFPHASVVFKDTRVKDPIRKDSSILFVERIYFKFNVIDMVRGNYTLNHIELTNGNIKLYTDKKGNSNFQKVFREKRDTTQKKFTLDLKKIILENMTLDYRNQRSDSHLSMLVEKATAKGKFGDENFELSTYGDFVVHEFQQEKKRWLDEDHIYADLSMMVYPDKERFVLQKGNLNFNSLKFGLTGKVITDERKTLDVQLKTRELDVQKLIRELPENITQTLKPYSFKGKTKADIHITETWKGDQMPHIESTFGFIDAQMEHKKTGVEIKNVNLEGNFTNGARNQSSTSRLTVDKFSGYFDRQKFAGRFTLSNLEHPKINLKTETTLDIQKLKQFAGLDTLEKASGLLDVKIDYSFSPYDINNLKPADFARGKSQGSVNLKDVNFKFKKSNNHFREINGQLSFNTEDVAIDNLKGTVNQNNDFLFNGYLDNLLPFLFFEDEKLRIIADMNSRHISLENLLKDSPEKNKDKSEYRLKLPSEIYFNFDMNIDELNFRKFNGENISGNVRLKNQVLYVDELDMNSMSGQLRMRGKLNAVDNDNIKVSGKGYLQKVKIDQAFYQLENFNQKTLTHKNIFGELTSDLNFSVMLNHALKPKENSFKTNADITVKKGKLVNFEPLEEMSSFLRVDDLSEVSFGKLKNTITISGNQVIIPKMEIKSDAANIKLRGKHSFDNEIEYYVEILLSELLSRKAKENKDKNSEFGRIRDDSLNRTTLFLKIYGNTENPKFAYDKEGLKKKLKKDIKKEKQELKQVMHEELGLFRNDSSVEQKPKTERQIKREKEKKKEEKRKERIKKQEEGNFIIEWEDE